MCCAGKAQCGECFRAAVALRERQQSESETERPEIDAVTVEDFTAPGVRAQPGQGVVKIQGDMTVRLPFMLMLCAVELFSPARSAAEINWLIRTHKQTAAVIVRQRQPAGVLMVAVVLRERVIDKQITDR